LPVSGTIVPIAAAEPTPSSCPVTGFFACRLMPEHGFTLFGHPATYSIGALVMSYFSGKKFDVCSSESYCGC
jgi:hypothetical protein